MLSQVDFGSLPQKKEKFSSCPETASKFMSILSNKMYVLQAYLKFLPLVFHSINECIKLVLKQI